MQELARQKRLENYGPDVEPEFTPALQAFRDEQLRKVDPTLESFQPSEEESTNISAAAEGESPSKIEQLTKDVDLLDLFNEDEPKITEVGADEEVENKTAHEVEDGIEQDEETREKSRSEDVSDEKEEGDDATEQQIPLEVEEAQVQTRPLIEEISIAEVQNRPLIEEIFKAEIVASPDVPSTEHMVDSTDVEEVILTEGSSNAKTGNTVQAWGKE
jgi:hypothetical protein